MTTCMFLFDLGNSILLLRMFVRALGEVGDESSFAPICSADPVDPVHDLPSHQPPAPPECPPCAGAPAKQSTEESKATSQPKGYPTKAYPGYIPKNEPPKAVYQTKAPPGYEPKCDQPKAVYSTKAPPVPPAVEKAPQPPPPKTINAPPLF